MWFLKFLLIVAVIYLLGYIFFKFILPWMLKRFVKRMAKKMNIPFEENVKKQKPGEVNIKYVPENKAQADANLSDGEYVDYEEIK
jgi:hypothetical protein